MARINLTLPDPLYERLERLRDRVNVSKICAVALEKELNQMEATATTHMGDDKVQRLVQRFMRQREARDRWYYRGKQDGEQWAIERAGLEELQKMCEEWDEGSIEDCEDPDEIDADEYPTFNGKDLLKRWGAADRVEAGGLHDTADWRAYLQGWWHGARDLWLAARTSLRQA